MGCCGTTPEELCKRPGETEAFSFDFSPRLATTETITTLHGVTATLIGGAASNLTIDEETISGQTITFTIAGGTHGKRYLIEAEISTSEDRRLELTGILVVKN